MYRMRAARQSRPVLDMKRRGNAAHGPCVTCILPLSLLRQLFGFKPTPVMMRIAFGIGDRQWTNHR